MRVGGTREMQRVGLSKRRGPRDTRGRPMARVVLATARSKACKSRVMAPMWVQGGARNQRKKSGVAMVHMRGATTLGIYRG